MSSATHSASRMTSARSDGLSGSITVPGDKSLSHRALMIAASAVGESRITGLLEGEDVLATAAALRQLGATITRDDTANGEDDEPVWRVHGVGVGGLTEPEGVLDLGNAGTGVRLLMGLVGGHPFTSFFTGDASLSARPMDRIMTPLGRMGVQFTAHSGGRLPLAVSGPQTPIPIIETPNVASAQVKSAILLCGLNAPGETTVIEPHQTRDHTERMLRHFGADVRIEKTEDGVAATLVGQPELSGTDVVVPADISSAAFPLIAAAITPGSTVTVRRVGLNALRAGLIECLREMGADMTVTLHSDESDGREPIADIEISSSNLKGIAVPAERAPSMIDEYPILAMAAACAEGPTLFEGVGELRVKESDRLATVAAGLTACGVEVSETEDSLTIQGRGKPPEGGATVSTDLDHRIAMSFLVLGTATDKPVTVDDASPIDTSFPGFADLMNGLGAQLTHITGRDD